MKNGLSLSLAALVAVPALVWAQGQTPAPANPPAAPQAQAAVKQEKQDIAADRKQMQELDAQHAAAAKDLNAKEKAARQAVLDDKSLTPAQRKAKLADIRKDFTAQRKALNEKFRSDKKKVRADMKKDRQDVRKDRKQLHQRRQDVRRDAGGKRK